MTKRAVIKEKTQMETMISKMKKILPIVVNPVNRCGVAASKSPMPPVDKGKANQAHVML